MKIKLINGGLIVLLLVVNASSIAADLKTEAQTERTDAELSQIAAANSSEAYRQCTQNCDVIKNNCMNQCQNNPSCQQQCNQQVALCYIKCRY